MALASTTNSVAIGSSDLVVTLASTTALTTIGMGLFVDGELLTNTALPLSNGTVAVRRGQGGSKQSAHGVTKTVYIGTIDKFYIQNPTGAPPTVPFITPWINVVTGSVWDVSGSAWIAVAGAGGGGDVEGPASATTGAVALYDGTTGTLIKDSKVVVTIPASTSTLTIAAGKTATVSNTLTLAGTDATTMTFPATSATIARTDAANTFTGVQSMTSPVLTTPDVGVATATSINKVAITAPATSATLTVANGKTLTASNSLTLAGTDATTMTFKSVSANVASCVTANANIVSGITALDGSNPTPVATGLTTIVGLSVTLNRSTALTSGTAFVTYNNISGGSFDMYGWILAGTASTGTENVAWVAIGT